METADFQGHAGGDLQLQEQSIPPLVVCKNVRRLACVLIPVRSQGKVPCESMEAV